MPAPYDRHNNTCLLNSEEGEPLFVLRAQDVLAPELVRLWAAAAARKGVNGVKVADAYQVADAMVDWQSAHGSKTPD